MAGAILRQLLDDKAIEPAALASLFIKGMRS
jgi:hypothetical protein